MKKTKKILIALIILALVAGAAAYFTIGENYSGRLNKNTTLQKNTGGNTPQWGGDDICCNPDIYGDVCQKDGDTGCDHCECGNSGGTEDDEEDGCWWIFC